MLLLWSDKPNGNLKFLSISKKLKFNLSIGVGYCDTQCKIVSLLFIFDIILTACLISCNDDIPVDKITLSKSWAHFFRSNKFVIFQMVS